MNHQLLWQLPELRGHMGEGSNTSGYYNATRAELHFIFQQEFEPTFDLFDANDLTMIDLR
jgi:hypothetical protein